MKVAIIFPHQLFEHNPAILPGSAVYLVEEFLFFRQYDFHRGKLKYHRATMKFYEGHLRRAGVNVIYVASGSSLSDVRDLIPALIRDGASEIHFCDVADTWLERRIRRFGGRVNLVEHPSPMFLNSREEVRAGFAGKKHYFQSDFYTRQRRQRRILVDDEFRPAGGKWSFDADNRRRYPKNMAPPPVLFPAASPQAAEAAAYVSTNFNAAYGSIDGEFNYPVTFDESRAWLGQFLERRFRDFGRYEDAIVAAEPILHHSLLSPMMNVGLITPAEVVDAAIGYAGQHDIPLNSLEGFVRQIVGWREFIRGVYEAAGTRQRTTNFWNFKRPIPAGFWNATTGIAPVDSTIRKVLATGYCHHIERLMVLGNFMLLCEFDPDEVYRWFMELFIDAYDWVMVPNVYGMSQFADGGLMATKPYISGSNYLMKMGDHPKGDWQGVWDALFWRFISVHRGFFLKNPRLGMLVRTFDKMTPEKRSLHIETSERFLAGLDR